MVRITEGRRSIGFSPWLAASVEPELTTDEVGDQAVRYQGVWPGVDLVYHVTGDSIKESVILESSRAANTVAFRFHGATLARLDKGDRDLPEFRLDSALNAKFVIGRAALALNHFGYESGAPAVRQSYRGGILSISVSRRYLDALPRTAFPVAIDPSLYRSLFGTRYGGNYVDFKTDGYICGSDTCNLYAGGLYDSQGRFQYWRGAFYSPYEIFRDPSTYMAHATLHLRQLTNVNFWTGTYDPHTFLLGHASCLNNFNCLEGGGWWASGFFGTEGDIEATPLYQTMLERGDYGAWMMVGGEDGSDSSYKNFDPNNSYVDFTYTHKPEASNLAYPGEGATVVTDQPLLSGSQAGDADGDLVSYRFRAATNPSFTGNIVDSGWLQAPRFTVPAGVLADGQTYYWKIQTWDGAYPDTAWRGGSITNSAIRSFRLDLRNGKDATQAFDEAGPVSVDSATGNLTTATETHSITALAGSIGVSATYNSPVRSRQGLVGQYWNLASGSTTIPSSRPNYTATDGAIDFGWGVGSPQPSMLHEDWFGIRWSGYFVAPATGDYYFGATNDDGFSVQVSGSTVYSSGGCSSGPCYGSSVHLVAGQIAPLKAEYFEATGPAYVHLWVKGAVTQQILPTSWLRTDVAPIATPHGLTGSYYYSDNNSAGPTFPDDGVSRLFLRRLDANVGFNWGDGAPVANGPADNFMVRWTGYFTAPAAGEYLFGTASDDGSRLWVNGTQTVDSWGDQPATLHMPASGITLTQGQEVPVTLEYYEHGGGASVELRVRGPGIDPETALPAQYLSPKVQVLPEGWTLGLDADGELNYEFAQIGSSSVILRDSHGETHEYKWNGSSYTPPVNETGTLVRNTDGTLTLQDEDGRTYVFNSDGTLQSASTPLDDRRPAALRYTYAGTPARLVQITDGVDASRTGKLVYGGDIGCPSAPEGFAPAPINMVCAFVTSDGPAGGSTNTTSFLYKADGTGTSRLARVVRPGGDVTDYGYDSGGTGLLVSLRTSVANDAIAAGLRTNDESTTTQIRYDILGRVSGVTEPAPKAAASRVTHAYEYGDHATVMHRSGLAEPHGFSRRVTYDEAFRTLTDTDVAGRTTTTTWDTDPSGTPRKDLVLSTTDPAGLMSTTLYDYADRATDEYGPAPAGWFGLERTPTADRVSDVPHTRTGYDEGIRGLAATYYAYSSTSHNFTAAPLAHDAALGNASGDVVATWNGTSPAPVPSGSGWGVRLTGDIRFDATGTYTFRIQSDDGARLYVDNQAVIDDWTDGSTRSHSVQLVNVVNTAPGSYHSIRLDYYNKAVSDGDANLALYMRAPGGTETSALGSILSPHYGLITSATTFDSSARVGTETTITNYGSRPELGQAQTTTVDPSGLHYTTTQTYEPQGGPGSLLRELSSTRPGGSKTEYTYYAPAETADNPCTAESDNFKQGGRARTIVELGTAGIGKARTTETVYDEAGRTVAIRMNEDPWTCMRYDARGRVIETKVPTIEGRPGATTSNSWAVGGNPLVSSISNEHGTVTTTSDLLGRVVEYQDARGDSTTTNYDGEGRITSRRGPAGQEQYLYNANGWLSEQLVDGTVVANPEYDAAGQLTGVKYPAPGESLAITRDALGRTTGMDYSLAGGKHVSDSVVRSQSGKIIGGNETGLEEHYEYDAAGRLTSATLGNTEYTYGFGAPSGCGSDANPNAGADGNRTQMIVKTGTTTETTNYCYDIADRLTSASDPRISTLQYDPHGNITQLGGGPGKKGIAGPTLLLGYDASDHNVSLAQGPTTIKYVRDALGRIVLREELKGSKSVVTPLGFTSAGEDPDLILKSNGKLAARIIQLPGGVLLTVKSAVANKSATMSLPNVHGDVMATTTGLGDLNGTYHYDPFGVPRDKKPVANGIGDTSYGWLGRHQKLSEPVVALDPVQMGARVYLPVLGRFTSPDPTPGGNVNMYSYPPDPITDFDLTGNFSLGDKAFSFIARNSSTIGWGLAVAGVFAGGPVAFGAVVAAEAIVTAVRDRSDHQSMKASLAHAALGAILSARLPLGRGVKWSGGRPYASFKNALRRSAPRVRLVRRLLQDRGIDAATGRVNHRWIRHWR